MYIQRILPTGHSAVALIAASSLLGFASCAKLRDRQAFPPGAPGLPAPSLHPDYGSIRTSPQQDLANAYAWIDKNLACAPEDFVDPNITYLLSEEAILLLVRAGNGVIPELMKYVRDHRETALTFYYPMSSNIGDTRMIVGELACYMIEAILRRNPFFTKSGRPHYRTPEGLGDVDERMYALDQAATAYEEWYEKCFEGEPSRFVCASDELPRVEWDYDLGAWQRLLEYRARWGKEEEDGQENEQGKVSVRNP